ncbi:MAG: RNA polymerase sigma factor [Candidatus Bruticola sp.]
MNVTGLKTPDKSDNDSADAALLERFQAGDDSAFDELMNIYYRPVLNLIYKFKGGTAKEAEDTAQEVFLQLYKALPRFELRARLFTYIYKVTMNQCLKERKKRAKDIPIQISLDEPVDKGGDRPVQRDFPDPDDSPLESIEYAEVSKELREALFKIDDEMRAPLLMNRFNNLTYEEIASILGITVAAVRSRIHRARQTLQKHLDKIFG